MPGPLRSLDQIRNGRRTGGMDGMEETLGDSATFTSSFAPREDAETTADITDEGRDDDSLRSPDI